MQETIIVCGECKKDSDNVQYSLITSNNDNYFIETGIGKGKSSQCAHCKRSLDLGEKFHVIDS